MIDNNQVTVKGREFTEGLANAVVIAYIYDKDDTENKGKPHIFSYAPVSFEKVFTEPHHFGRFKMIFMILSFAIAVACSVFLVFTVFYCIKKRTKQDNTAAI